MLRLDCRSKAKISWSAVPCHRIGKEAMNNESPFACVMDAIAADKRAPHLTNAKILFDKVTDIRELENGYAFCLGRDSAVLAPLTEFIALEKLCCPFFAFTIRVEPEGGDIWLELTGREGVKPFIRAEISEIVGRPSANPLVARSN